MKNYEQISCRGNVVSIVTRLRAGQYRIGFPAEAIGFISSETSRPAVGPTLFSGHRGSFPVGKAA